MQSTSIRRENTPDHFSTLPRWNDIWHGITTWSRSYLSTRLGQGVLRYTSAETDFTDSNGNIVSDQVDRGQIMHSSCVVEVAVADLAWLAFWAAEDADLILADLVDLAAVEAAVKRRGGIFGMWLIEGTEPKVTCWIEHNFMHRLLFANVWWLGCVIEESPHCSRSEANYGWALWFLLSQ